VRLEGLGQLKNPMTASGFDPATFRLVSQPNTLPRAREIKKPFSLRENCHEEN
jgi:hypothetical protein